MFHINNQVRVKTGDGEVSWDPVGTTRDELRRNRPRVNAQDVYTVANIIYIGEDKNIPALLLKEIPNTSFLAGHFVTA